jgi:hypothetical protein
LRLWVTVNDSQGIQNTVSISHAYADAEKRVLHQSVLTAEILRLAHGYDVAYAIYLYEAFQIFLNQELDDRQRTLVLLFFDNSVQSYSTLVSRLEETDSS